MKTLSKLFVFFILIALTTACKKKKEEVAPVETTPEYQTAIDAKFKAIGWATDGHSKFNNSNPVKTAGGKGYVQYYAFGSRKTAIYYFPSKGAFAMDTEEMTAYDNAGQDNWGLVVSDPKATKTGGCGYNDIITTDGKEAIITCQNLFYGNVYAKYKEVGRWDGPLGLPTASELPTPADNGRFGTFQNGVIWFFPATGTNAIWGKVLKLYNAIDYERSWLGKPIESCDPKKGDANQRVAFQNGAIGVGNTGTCGNYYDKSGLSVLQTGKIGTPPCY
jgi:uncharacterized protein with LGFP repeats